MRVVHCLDVEPLPIGVRLKQLTGAKLVYDAHELETERTHLKKLRKRIVRVSERRCKPYVDAMITVSPSIQNWYRERFPRVPVSLVRNVPTRPDAGFRRTDAASVPDFLELVAYRSAHRVSQVMLFDCVAIPAEIIDPAAVPEFVELCETTGKLIQERPKT